MTATSDRINPADHLPDYVSPAQVKGLLGNVDIWRDAWGIPHVRGGTYQDAFAGLGFAQAQDRLWQMEALLRRGTGRYAEWLGARAVAGDVIARQMNGEAASRRDYAALGDEAKAMLAAYAPASTRSSRCAAGRWNTGSSAANRRAWEPWHAIAVMRQRGFLMGSVWFKLWRAAALPIVGADAIAKLRFDDGGSDLLCVPPGVEGKRLAAALADLARHRGAAGDRAGAMGADSTAAATTGRSRPSAPRPAGRWWPATRIACSRCRACTRRRISPATSSTSSA